MADEKITPAMQEFLDKHGQRPAAVKPGYKTTEFWLTLVAGGVGAFLASGVFPDTHWAVKVAGMAATVLSVIGYQVQRTRAKS